MSGFFSTILSLLLGWVRTLISQLWQLFNSENGSALGAFLAKHWLWLVAGLCAAGVLIDLTVYFFRWRPDYVWATKLRRLRHREPQPEPEAEPMPSESPFARPYQPPVQEPAEDLGTAYAPVQEPLSWDTPLEPADDWILPADEEKPAGPEPGAYYRDMQAGFAPAIPPEQLYTPSASYQAPVHPGLDEASFRQSFGLQTDEEAMQERSAPVVYAQPFHPFTEISEEAPAHTASPLSRLARRARSLVGGEPEDQPSIHDLQTTVDVSQAFYAPVYPQPMEHKEG